MQKLHAISNRGSFSRAVLFKTSSIEVSENFGSYLIMNSSYLILSYFILSYPILSYLVLK